MTKTKRTSMKSPIIQTIVIVVLAVAAGPLIYFDSVAANPKDVAAEFSRLEKSGNENAQDWLQLTRDARDTEQLELAGAALDKASTLGLAPVQVGMETARILVARNDPAGATAELQKLFTAGFTAVSVLTNDPLINSMEGRSDYDELVQKMSVQAYPCAHQQGFRDFDFWIGEWVDKASGEWVQVWNAANGAQINIRGGLTGDGMLLEGYIHYVNNGTTAPFRGLWTQLPDGRVRQFFEQSNDDGKTWVSWFEAFYTRSN
jgi:hypothetical protein